MLQLNSLLSPNTYKLGLVGVCGPASLNKGNITRGPIAGLLYRETIYHILVT